MDVNDRRRSELRINNLYALWLDRATRAGFAISLVAFLLYIGGALPAYVPVQELTRYWQLPVHRFIEVTGAPSGWAWLSELRYGDGLNLAAVALLGLVTPLCYARLLPALIAQRDWLQTAIALLQLVVLLAATSGLLAG
jgi:hypothetical protein